MAEALAAVGLVGNIVQFVDFGTKLLSTSRSLFHSSEGALQENVDLEKVTASIRSVTQDIANNTIGVHEPKLRKLAGTCVSLAEELLALLSRLKIDTTKNRKLEVIEKSFKSLRFRRSVNEINERLCKVRDQVCMELTYLLSRRQASLLPAIHDLADVTKVLSTETQNKVDRIRAEILRILAQRASKEEQDSATLSNLSTTLINLVEQSRALQNIYVFLKSLHFKQIKTRQFEVKTAHTNTFGWIFDENSGKQQFAQWLRSSSGIFWIAGKAGSGKSTLMKFLKENPRLKTLLEGWAGSRKLFIAAHFFWIAGTTMQKSQEGLLRTLLFQILANSPDLIPIVCPNRWITGPIALSSLEPWSLPELSQALEAIASLDDLPTRFCLLVDGLDEYDGDHSEIVQVIQTISKSPHIKLCVSSRPWTVFVDAFHNSDWKFYLQDLTRNDIRLYIKDNLEENADFRDLKSREPAGSENLVQQIVSKAQGVFLWVYLVVRSLLRGLTNRDDMSDLVRRLGELPGHLEAYFRHMLDTIEDVYQQQTAQTFRIMVNASRTLPLIALHFIDHEKNDPDYALRLEIGPILHSKFVATVDTKRRQLSARCKDLVEVTEDKEKSFFLRYGVCFLHRTVLDFLTTSDMETLMTTRSGPDFKPNLTLCRAYLAQTKAVPALDHSKTTILRNLVLGTTYYARQMEVQDGMAATAILDSLHNTLQLLFHEKHVNYKKVFPGHEFGSILQIAVRAGLELYVNQKASSYSNYLQLQSLLSRALQPAISIRKDFAFEILPTSEVDLSMLNLLLDLCASKGDESFSNHCDVWQTFLYSQREKNHAILHAGTYPVEWDMSRFLSADIPSNAPKVMTNFYDACELMILHGQSKGLYFRGIKQALKEALPHDQAKILLNLFAAGKERSVELNRKTDPAHVRIYRAGSSSWWDPRSYLS